MLDVASLRRFAVAVGATPDVEREPPPFGHWAYFLDAVPTARMGSDGHPERGDGLLPPIRLPRRMFAAASVIFTEPLSPGQDAELTLRLIDVTHRVGKTGDLVLVQIDRILRQQGRERVAERQTIVYRGPNQPLASIESADRPLQPGEQAWTPSPVELFRFSAVTFNAHRIHYDLPYARTWEGYPDLVVQGPLTAIKLFAFVQGRSPRKIRKFSFRASAPLFVGQRVVFTAGNEQEKVDCIRCDGAVAMSAVAAFDNAGLEPKFAC